jgi:hypothetical protein
MTSNQQFISGNLSKWILPVCWIIVQLTLFYTQGIVTVNEAQKYITRADILIETGTLSHPSMWLYSTQIMLIAIAKKFGTGYFSVVLVQLLVNAIATYCLYRLANKLTNELTALIITLLLILNFPFQSFNTTLYTESIYYSLLILLTCFLLQLSSLTFGNSLLLFLLMLIICFTRPSGLLLVPCVFIYLFTKFFHAYSFWLKAGLTFLITFVFLVILNKLIGIGGQLDFMLPFKEEHIICGVPTLAVEQVSTPESSSFFGIFGYIIQHPDQFLRLAAARTKAFFGLTRDYYSDGHNIYLVLYIFPIYFLLLFSIISWWRTNKAILIYCLSFILITWVTVILTCDDWHNRFFLSTIPFIYLLSQPGLKKLLSKFSKK